MCIQEFPLWFRMWSRGGKKQTRVQRQPCRAASNRHLFPLPFSGTEHCAHLDEAKTSQQCCYSACYFSAVISGHFENRSNKDSARYRPVPWLLMLRVLLIRISWQDRSVYVWGDMCKLIFFAVESYKYNRVTRQRVLVTGQSEHSPGNRNAGVSIGDHAVLLFRVNHGGVNCQGGTGVDYWTGSMGNKNNVQESIARYYISTFGYLKVSLWLL